jgi:hypothetical protein
MFRNPSAKLTAAIFAAFLCSDLVVAQSVPTDLLDVSIEDLLQANVISDFDETARAKRWSFAYSYQASVFRDYYIDDSKVSGPGLIWDKAPGPKPVDQYLAITPEIIQEVHGLFLAYDWDDTYTLRFIAPLISQTTDHNTVIPGFSRFDTETHGLGDLQIGVDTTLARTVNSQIRLGVGLSLPTGSVDERGNTPQGENKPLPYTMQMGSGTFDVPVNLHYAKSESRYRWGGGVSGVYRIGENEQGYRLGHRFGLDAWAHLTNFSGFEPGIRLGYHYQGQIEGQDKRFNVPDAFGGYPTPVLDPDTYGGETIDLAVFVRLPIWDSKVFMDAEYTKPIYLNLNGPQVATSYHFALTFSTAF